MVNKSYDYASVMHYPENAFAKNHNLKTIVARTPKYQKVMGQFKYLSVLDVQALNLYYQCGGKHNYIP